jgi:hypothetical protein
MAPQLRAAVAALLVVVLNVAEGELLLWRPWVLTSER